MIAIAPDRYEGYLFRAVNERQKGNAAEAQKQLREACRRAGGITLPFIMLGQSLETSGDSRAALAYNQAAGQSRQPRSEGPLRRLNGDQQFSAARISDRPRPRCS